MRVAEGAFGVLVAIAGLLFTILVIGSVVPVVHEHCVPESGSDASGNLDVSSSWKFTLDFPLPASDDKACVRNTPTREALSAIGIWSLGSPAEQLGEATGQSLEGKLGEGTSEYFKAVFGLRQESDRIAEEGFKALNEAQSREEALSGWNQVLDDSRALAAKLAALTPPDSLAELHQSLLDANQSGIDAIQDLVGAIQFGSRADIAREYQQFLDYAREAQRHLRELALELRQEFK